MAPVTAHAAFEKAAHLLGIRIRHVPVGVDGRADVNAMRRAIDSDVCMVRQDHNTNNSGLLLQLVGSAPCFSTGTFDPIPHIAEVGDVNRSCPLQQQHLQLGASRDIPVHVDACLGSFIVPFMAELGARVPRFDFRVRGVCSISCDTHKYGYAPKGSSTVLYRSNEYLHHQYFSITEWPGGIYATPSIAGWCHDSTDYEDAMFRQ